MKIHLLLCMGVLVFATTLNAQMEGPLSPATITTEVIPGAKKSWKNIENVSSSDNAYADFDLGGGGGNYSDYLVARDFAFTIPDNVIITGISVEIERSDSKNNMSDYSVRIVKYGVISGTEQSRGTNFPTTDGYEVFGGPNELWGESWMPSDINDRYFGVAISVQENSGFGGSSGRIDHIRVTVHFSNSKTLPLRLLSFSGTKKDNTVQLKWMTVEESEMSHYELQRSADGRNYTTLQSIPSRNSNSLTIYDYTDTDPIRGTATYRLKMVGKNSNDIKYSSIITVKFAETIQFTLWPAIISTGQMVKLNNPKNEKLTICFFSNSGQQVEKIHTGSSQFSTQPLSQKGVVVYHVYRDDGELAGTGRLIIQ